MDGIGCDKFDFALERSLFVESDVQTSLLNTPFYRSAQLLLIQGTEIGWKILNQGSNCFFVLDSCIKKGYGVAVMTLQVASSEAYIFHMVAWQNILNCRNNLVYVLSGVGTESNINIGYRQLRQNLSHTRIKTL